MISRCFHYLKCSKYSSCSLTKVNMVFVFLCVCANCLFVCVRVCVCSWMLGRYLASVCWCRIALWQNSWIVSLCAFDSHCLSWCDLHAFPPHLLLPTVIWCSTPLCSTASTLSPHTHTHAILMMPRHYSSLSFITRSARPAQTPAAVHALQLAFRGGHTLLRVQRQHNVCSSVITDTCINININIHNTTHSLANRWMSANPTNTHTHL